MRRPAAFDLLILILALAAIPPGRARAGEDGPLRAGQYEVEVRLELPHVEDLNMKKIAAVCVVPDRGDGTLGLAVLGDNNPLSKCPASNVRREGKALAFEIVCEGTNAARASASYTLAGDAFHGRIAMKMGGKNMTMSETQVGRRVGACPKADAPRH